MTKKKMELVRRLPPGSDKVVESKIFVVRGQKVMLATDLAKLYRVSAKVFNQAVRRNAQRFPEDFMFQLKKGEATALRSQIVTLDIGRGQFSKYLPMVFTEPGVAMLSGVLSSELAIQMNILIIRAFVKLREQLALHKDLALRLDKVEIIQDDHANGIVLLAEQIQEMKQPKPLPSKTRIGFHPPARPSDAIIAPARKKMRAV